MKPGVDALAAAIPAKENGAMPPVHLWNPPDQGDIDMRIARDGTWFYQGTPITRPAMVRLFSTILRKDGDRYVLVTPVEKVGITVEDVPFIAVDVDVKGAGRAQRLSFTTNVGDIATAARETPLRFDTSRGDAPVPYIRVRANLDARIDRKTFYRLMELTQEHRHQGRLWYGLWSQDAFFPVHPVPEENS